MHALLRRQLRKAGLGDSLEAVPEALRGFVATIDQAYTSADADRRQLEHSLQLASDELYERNRALGAQREELARRARDMALILDNVDQGFVTVGTDGAMSHEASRTLARWFGPVIAGTPVWSYLAGHAPDVATWMEFGWDNLDNPHMPLEVVMAQLPDRIDQGGRNFRIGYQRIGNPLAAVLVVVTDITDELARQRAEAEQRELIAVVERAYRDRAGFVGFVREAATLIRSLLGAAPLTLDEVKRAVHTLKGNAALFGAVGLAEACHTLEDQIEESQALPSAAELAALGEQWRAFHGRVDRLLGVSERRSILVDWEEYQAVVSQLVEPEPVYAARLRGWGLDPVRAHLERLADDARALAERLGKGVVDIAIRDHELRLDGERFAPVWSSLVHAVHNAVVHGLETPAVRALAGKPAHAHLTLSADMQSDQLVIEVSDDGAGVDWAAVAGRAQRLGLPSATDSDLVDALFASGMSTAGVVTDVAGRGVGMGALRAACAELGGRVEVSTSRGRGTTIRCTLPLPRPDAAQQAARRERRRTTLAGAGYVTRR
jgi:HPt (histidine-containing phosphotransfer) domain-containing protein